MRTLIIVFCFITISKGQISIPLPTVLSSKIEEAISKDSLRSLPVIKIYTRPDLTTLQPASTHNINDFDGDGSDDIVIIWNAITSVNTFPYDISSAMFGIYSIKKSSYLFQETGAPGNFTVGDFDGDGVNELIVGKSIYKYAPTLSKKKVF